MRFIKDEATGMYGYPPWLRDETFSGADSDEDFQKNLKTLPESWVYRNTEVLYKRNELGHRSVPLADITAPGYILTVGCSFTEGIGLPLEWTWPYVLSQKMGLPYYNLGLASVGPDFAMYNLCRFLVTCPHTPGYIVLMMPPPDRLMMTPEGAASRVVKILSTWTLVEPGWEKFFKHNVKYNTFETNLLKIDATWKVLRKLMTDTKFVCFSFHDMDQDQSNQDLARDRKHRGQLTNEYFANFALNLINTR